MLVVAPSTHLWLSSPHANDEIAMALTVLLEPDPILRSGVQQRLTAQLADWFKQGEASLKYAEKAEILSGYIARIDNEPKGLLLYKKHGRLAAEIL